MDIIDMSSNEAKPVGSYSSAVNSFIIQEVMSNDRENPEQPGRKPQSPNGDAKQRNYGEGL
jgi:hypothetical protein